MGLHIQNILTIKNNFPLFGVIKTVDTIKKTGFTCPIGPDDRKDLTFLNAGAYPSQSLKATKAQMDIFDLELDLFCHNDSPSA